MLRAAKLAHMRKALASLIAVLALPSLAAAGEVEIGGFAGYTFPFYSQTYKYDPGPVVPDDLPGVSIQQSGSFELKASGGLVFGGAVAYFPVDAAGLELRFDSANLTIKTQSPTYNVTATLPGAAPPRVRRTSRSRQSEAKLSSAQPFSLNLKLRTPGETRVFLSGGLSYLPNMGFSLEQTVALGVSEVNLITNELKIPTITLRAKRKPGDPESNWGGNAGSRLPGPARRARRAHSRGPRLLLPEADLRVGGRRRPQDATRDVQKELLDGVLRRVEPKTVEFTPWWVQVTIGVCYRF